MFFRKGYGIISLYSKLLLTRHSQNRRHGQCLRFFFCVFLYIGLQGHILPVPILYHIITVKCVACATFLFCILYYLHFFYLHSRLSVVYYGCEQWGFTSSPLFIRIVQCHVYRESQLVLSFELAFLHTTKRRKAFVNADLHKGFFCGWGITNIGMWQFHTDYKRTCVPVIVYHVFCVLSSIYQSEEIISAQKG